MILFLSLVAHTLSQPILAPYFDISASGFDLSILSSLKLSHLSLAFANYNCEQNQPVWGGPYEPIDSKLDIVKQIREYGTEIIISFGGGYQSTQTMEPAGCGLDVETLFGVYKQFIEMYSATLIDFDIEGSGLDDSKSVELRLKALKKIRDSYGSKLSISFTLPVSTQGLLQNSIDLITKSKGLGVDIDLINLMTMDYGGNVNEMGKTAIQATDIVISQLQQLGIQSKVGITPMVGKNDTPNEEFTIENAVELVGYVSNNERVGRVSYWSLGRDYSNSQLQFLKAFQNGHYTNYPTHTATTTYSTTANILYPTTGISNHYPTITKSNYLTITNFGPIQTALPIDPNNDDDEDCEEEEGPSIWENCSKEDVCPEDTICCVGPTDILVGKTTCRPQSHCYHPSNTQSPVLITTYKSLPTYYPSGNNTNGYIGNGLPPKNNRLVKFLGNRNGYGQCKY